MIYIYVFAEIWEISFLGMPQIAHAFSSRKIKQLPTVTGRGTLLHTLPPLNRYAPVAKIAPPNVLAHYTPLSILPYFGKGKQVTYHLNLRNFIRFVFYLLCSHSEPNCRPIHFLRDNRLGNEFIHRYY